MGGDSDKFDAQRSTDLDGLDSALDAFKDAALMWAGTGYGKPLVDAAVDALSAGLDSPTLRVLAGAPARFADEEATEYAPDTFDELGLAVPEKHSEEAYLELAKLRARKFLEGEWSARRLAVELWRLSVNSGYRAELADFSGLYDWYVMLDDRVIQGDSATVDAAVRESAQRLVEGLPGQGSRLGGAFMGHQYEPEKKVSFVHRIKRRFCRPD